MWLKASSCHPWLGFLLLPILSNLESTVGHLCCHSRVVHSVPRSSLFGKKSKLSHFFHWHEKTIIKVGKIILTLLLNSPNLVRTSIKTLKQLEVWGAIYTNIVVIEEITKIAVTPSILVKLTWNFLCIISKQHSTKKVKIPRRFRRLGRGYRGFPEEKETGSRGGSLSKEDNNSGQN